MAGTTDWKVGADAAELIREAQARRKTVHLGRVNTWSRWAYAESLGVDTVDGTYLTYAPDTNLARLRSWHARSSPPTPRTHIAAA